MSWQLGLLLAAGLGVALCVLCVLVGVLRQKPDHLSHFDARVGRDVWRDIRGLTK